MNMIPQEEEHVPPSAKSEVFRPLSRIKSPIWMAAETDPPGESNEIHLLSHFLDLKSSRASLKALTISGVIASVIWSQHPPLASLTFISPSE
jgi:hypothetical protein